MTVQDATNYLNSIVGKGMNFDGLYGNQCVDLFNFYYKYLVGASPYSHGYGVPGAKDLWNIPTSRFTKIANNPNDPNQLPPKGAVIIWPGSLAGSGGYGHVAIVDSATATTLTVWQQNWGGRMYVTHDTIKWPATAPIGWMIFNGFSTNAQGDIMDTATGKELYWTALHRAPESDAAAGQWNGQVAGKALAVIRTAQEWQTLDYKIQNYDAILAQLKQVQTALANEQAKPPKEVIKEVEKIIEKEVIKEVPVYTHDEETKQAITRIETIVKSIKGLVLNLFKRK